MQTADLTKRKNLIFTHVGLSLSACAMRTIIIIVQEVKVHGWLLSGSEESQRRLATRHHSNYIPKVSAHGYHRYRKNVKKLWLLLLC